MKCLSSWGNLILGMRVLDLRHTLGQQAHNPLAAFLGKTQPFGNVIKVGAHTYALCHIKKTLEHFVEKHLPYHTSEWALGSFFQGMSIAFAILVISLHKFDQDCLDSLSLPMLPKGARQLRAEEGKT